MASLQHRFIATLGAFPTIDFEALNEASFGDAAQSTVLDIVEEGSAKPTIDTTQTSLWNLPLLGRIHYVPEIQGSVLVAATYLYWLYNVSCTYALILIPHYYESHIHGALLVIYLVIALCTIVALYRASTANPGRAYSHMTEYDLYEDRSDWTWCAVCCFKRPPRAHHCRRCNHCTLRMDHHCPWINNCVGQENHYLFMQLVFYAFSLSVMTLCIVLLYMYRLPPCHTCDTSTKCPKKG